MQTGQTFEGGTASGPRGLAARFARLDTRTTDRWIKRLALVLVVGTVAIGAIYAIDRVRLPEPTLVDRSVLEAEQAVQANPNLLSARLHLATAYEAVGRRQDAVAQYDQVLSVKPETIAALLGRGRLLLALDERPKAATDFATVVALLKDTEMARVSVELQDAYYSLGVIAMANDEPTEAIAHLTAALKITGTDADALYQLGRAYVATEAPGDAVQVLTRALALVPWGWCEPYLPLGEAYTAVQDTAGAAYAGGMLAGCEGRFDEAVPALAALTSGTHRVDALIGLALVAEARKDPATAAGYYAEVYAEDHANFAAVTGLNRLDANEDGTLRAPAGE